MKNAIVGMVLLMMSFPSYSDVPCAGKWTYWENFARVHIQDDGRVVDMSAEDISTSEGQSYALFFALVANDKSRFDHILKWTTDNLANTNLSMFLPGWKWGKSADGSWRLLDINPAGDADLWMAYSLFQASDRWKDKSYRYLAVAMLANIARREVADLPGMGRMLLPASYGFALDAGTWRLNPSYMPIQLLRYFAKVDSKGPWDEIIQNTSRMISLTSNGGRVPDWALYGVGKGFYADAEKGQYSSYDAIRVYLWWAMLDRRDPLFVNLKPYLSGVAQFVPDDMHQPERINVKNGNGEGNAPVGFAAALAPYRYVLYQYKENTPASFNDGEGYYNHVLSMFGYGWMDQRFSFDLDGSLLIGSEKCSSRKK